MAVDERRRHEMYLKLEDALGREAADTLMQHLPPAGWADVATKHDLMLLKKELEGVELRLDAKLESKLNAQTRALVVLVIGSNATLAGLAFAAARLA